MHMILRAYRWRSAAAGLLVLGIAAVLAWPGGLQAHGDLLERITAVTRSIQESPRSGALYLQRGQLHRQHEELSEAIADFYKALELEPTLELARLGLGRAFLESGCPKAALPELENFLSQHPKNPEALVLRAQAQRAVKNYPASVSDYTAALAVASTPTPGLFLERAEVLLLQGKLREAIAGLDEGVARLGHAPALERKAVELEESRNDYAAALRRLDEQVARAPRKEFLLYERALLLEKDRRFSEASKSASEAVTALETLPPGRRAAPALKELTQNLQKLLNRLPDSPALKSSKTTTHAPISN